MSKEIDEKVVEMQFNNKDFENNVKTSMGTIERLKKSLNFKGASKGLEDINSAAKNVDVSPISNGLSALTNKFSALQVMGVTALANITNSAVNAGKRITSALTIAPITTGFTEYETQINAIQTILANTESKGSTLQDVNKALDELNTYADKTIYNFTEMTKNIGTFTAAGVELDKSVTSIKGIANLAAISGSTSVQASSAMYQLSQALAAGRVSLMDWNSVVNAGMGGEVFQTALKRTAENMGADVDALIEKYGSFRESLTQGEWLTAEVLTETLTQLSGAYSEADLIAKGYTQEQAKQIKSLADTAVSAATEVKTFTQLWDTLKESAQSGWTNTWEILVGDFGEAKELLTGISDSVGGFINSMNDSRNEVLSGAFSTGWKQLLGSGINDAEKFEEIVKGVAKEHGVSLDSMINDETTFQDTLKEGWLTSDMLSESLKKYGDQLNSMSVDELKAAGYTSEHVEQFKKLQTEIQNGSVSIDDFVDKINRASGRELVIQSLINIFSTLGKIVKPIGEAFKEVIPAITAERVYELLSKFKELTDTFKVSEDTLDKIKRTFKGVFSIFTIGKNLISGFLSLFTSNADILGPIIDGFLSFTAVVGDYITGIAQVIDKTNLFKSIFAGIGAVLKPFINVIKSVLGWMGDLFDSVDAPDMSGIERFITTVTTKFKPLSTLGEFLEGIFSGLIDVIGNIGSWLSDTFGGLIGNIGKIFKSLIDGIGYLFEGDIFGKLVSLVTGGAIMKLIFGLQDIVDKVKGIFSGGSDDKKGGSLFSGFNDALDSLKGTLESFQNSIKADVVVKIAIAVGILAASLNTLSKIDGNKLAVSLGAIGALMAELMIGLTIFELIAGGKDFKGMGKATTSMILMATAIKVLASTMDDLAKLDWDGITKGLVGIAGMAAILVGSSVIMSKFSGSTIKASTGIILMSTAINILAKAVESFGGMDSDALLKGISTVGVLMGGFALFSNTVGRPEKIISTSIALNLISTSMVIMSNAISKLGGMDSEDLTKGLLSVAGVLLTLVVAMAKMPTTKILTISTSLVILGGSLLIISESIEQLGGLDVETLAKGIISIVSALGGIALMMSAMPTTSVIATSAGLVILSGALLVITQAIKQLGGMETGDLIQGLIGLGVALTEIAIAINFMQTALPGAAALLVVAGALRVLTPALKSLGEMSIGQLIISLVALAGSLTIIGVAGALIAPIVPALIGLSVAIALLGIGGLAAGAGILALATGLTMLSVAGASGIATFALLIKELLNLIPLLVQKLGEALIAFVQVIADGAPALAEAFLNILKSMTDVIVQAIPTIVEAILQFITVLLEKLSEYLPRIIEAGVSIIMSLLQGIRDNIGEIVVVVSDIIVNFINGIAEKLPDIIDAGFNLMIEFINGITNSVEENMPLVTEAVINLFMTVVNEAIDTILSFIGGITDAGSRLIDGLIDGIIGMISAVVDTVASIPSKCIDAIWGYIDRFWTIGSQLIDGFVGGITNGISSAIYAIQSMGSSVIDAALGIFGIHSPSRVFKGIAGYVVDGFSGGISKFGHRASAATEAMGNDAINTMNGVLSNLNFDNISSEPTIRPVLDMSLVEKGASAIGGMFNNGPKLALEAGVIGNVNSISANMSRGQNGGNNDIVSAINDLKNTIGSGGGNTYNLNGITYDDGSNVSGAVKSLIRAAKVERRV